MKQSTEPCETPAPQLPNIPISPDDPLQPDLERHEPVTAPPREPISTEEQQ
ncbi:MAG: hypothetical protein U0Y68_08355 [Blastocatellia bacterium]